jgi:hypothetical protein
MNRLFVSTLAVIAFATAANAATVGLFVNPDKAIYHPGDTITLTVDGFAVGATAYGIFGRLQFTGMGSVSGKTQTQTRVGTSGWTLGALGNGAGYSDAFYQTASFGNTANRLPNVNPFSTVTLIAGTVGVVNVAWDTTSPGFELDFFGVTSAPGTSFTILHCSENEPGCSETPEPTTGALLALGLLGLAGWRTVRA